MDWMLMKEQGYGIADIARKHRVTEKTAKELIKKINENLRQLN